MVFTDDSEEDRIYDMRARNACGLKINKIELFFLCRGVLIISIKNSFPDKIRFNVQYLDPVRVNFLKNSSF